MDMPLVRTKLYPPNRRAELVERPRLLERLQQGLNGKLTLISAPAGYGKTTLLSDLAAWVAGQVDAQPTAPRLAWLSLDEDDNDPVRFWGGVVAALQTVAPGIGSESLLVLHAAQSKANPQQASQRFIAQLINELLASLQEASYTILLVLDDYHAITHPIIQSGVGYLLDRLPKGMHLLIATRADPPLPLARLRGRGELHELRQKDLRFTPAEADAFLRRALGYDLTPEQVNALADCTEGWAAGLQLTAVSLRDQPDIPAYIRTLSGGAPFILDYLLEEILLRQPQPIQEFLLRTSILDSMCAALCDALLDGQTLEGLAFNSQQALEELHRANLFIIPLDPQRCWFRYHHLFAALLRQSLQHAQPGLLPELHARASAWYACHHYRNEAVRHALSGGLNDQAASLMIDYAQDTLMHSEIGTFLGWVNALPERSLAKHPLLALYRTAMNLLSGGPLDEATHMLDKIRQADTRGLLSGELNAVYAMIASYRGDLQTSMSLANQALEQISDDNLFLKSFIAGLLGLNALIHGQDAESADRVLDEAFRLALRSGNYISAIVAIGHRGELAYYRGDLHQAEALYQKAWQLAVDDAGQPLPVAGLALGGLGSLQRLHGQLDDALRSLESGAALNNRWSLIASLNNHVERARILRLLGDYSNAGRAVQTALDLAQMFDAMQYDDLMVQAEQANLWLAKGRLADVQAYAEANHLSPKHATPDEQAGNYDRLIGAYQYQTLARLYLAKKQPALALKTLAPWLRLLEAQGWNLLLVECLCLQAIAHWQKRERQLAFAALQRALVRAEPQQIIFPFLEGGRPMQQLLAACQEELEQEVRPESPPLREVERPGAAVFAFIDRLLAMLGAASFSPVDKPGCAAPGAAPAVPAMSGEALVEPLSSRELEVLALVAQGHSNQEIARLMVISLHTVKWHLSNIFAKLGVKNRSQAVAHARRMSLLGE